MSAAVANAYRCHSLSHATSLSPPLLHLHETTIRHRQVIVFTQTAINSGIGIGAILLAGECIELKGSDTSTAESGSEAEEVVSPKAPMSYSHLILTPVREEVTNVKSDLSQIGCDIESIRGMSNVLCSLVCGKGSWNFLKIDRMDE